MQVKNKVQLVTYPDSLGGDLPNLAGALGGETRAVLLRLVLRCRCLGLRGAVGA